jgi:excisionase family DNA binding protein
MSDNYNPLYHPLHASIKEICARHSVSRSHVYDLLGAGKITAVKNGRRLLVNVPSADAHFAALPPAVIKPMKRVAPAPADSPEVV